MKISIIPVDGAVVKDGVGYVDLDLSVAEIPDDVRALQWVDSAGEVEYLDNETSPVKTFPTWAEAALGVWAVAHEEATAPEPEPRPRRPRPPPPMWGKT